MIPGIQMLVVAFVALSHLFLAPAAPMRFKFPDLMAWEASAQMRVKTLANASRPMRDG